MIDVGKSTRELSSLLRYSCLCTLLHLHYHPYFTLPCECTKASGIWSVVVVAQNRPALKFYASLRVLPLVEI